MSDMSSALGAYLFTKRTSRGYDSIPSYLASFSSTDVISESYYRDIETGRKQIRIPTAQRLCEQLDLDRKAFYYFLLRDLIPDDLFGELVAPSAVETYRSQQDRTESIEQELKEAGGALMAHIHDSITELDAPAIDLLNQDEAILAALHFLYNRKSVKANELYQVYQRNGGRAKLASFITQFQSLNVAKYKSKTDTLTPLSKTIKVPRNSKGVEFKDNFLMNECAKSLHKRRVADPTADSGTWAYSALIPLNAAQVERVFSVGMRRLVATLESGDLTLEDSGTRPFFASIILSSREEYDCKPSTDGV